MKKNDFILTLKKYLSALPENERNDIICDFEEHFIFEYAKGKKEEEIIEQLGKPDIIAKQFIISKKLQKSNGNTKIADMIKTIRHLYSISESSYKVYFIGFAGLLFLSSIFALGLFVWGALMLLSFAGVSSLSTVIGTPYLSVESDMFLGIGILCTGIAAIIFDFLFLEYYYKSSIASFETNIKNLKGGI